MLIAIVEDGARTDAERDVVSIFDVNERVAEVRKELRGLKGIRKELSELKETLFNGQKRKQDTAQHPVGDPQLPERQVSHNDTQGAANSRTHTS